METPNKKKVLSWISFILSAAIFAFALAVFIISMDARAKNDRVELFGYSFAVVVTDSMYPEIKVGDLIIAKSCDITEVEEGENIVFMGLSGNAKGKCIVHKVVGIYDIYGDSGEKTGIKLETWGINNTWGENEPHYDEEYVYADNFIGKAVFHSTALGNVVTFLQNPVNWIYVFVFVIAIAFAVHQIIKIVRLTKNKEQTEQE